MRRLLRRAWAIPTAIAIAAAAATAQGSFDSAVAQRLKTAALNGRAFDYAADLTGSIGPRLSGTPSYERAAHWAEAQFQSAGLAAVRFEPFTIRRGWERVDRGRGRVLTPIDRPLVVESLGWAPSLPDGGIDAEVVDDRSVSANSDRARGRIVFVGHATGRDFDRQMQRAGALALLLPAGGDDNEIAARVRAFDGEIAALPMALVSADSTHLLRGLLDRGPVTIHLEYRNRISDGPVTVSNVIAEIPGRGDEFILVGAHLDSWDSATGAQDNATGVAMVLEAARAIAALGNTPRRTIRFALWGAEEQGLFGSTAYAGDHERELERCVAVLNADGGTGRIIGWTTPGRDDVMREVRELSRVVLADLHADRVDKSMRYAFDSDGGPFIRQGIPTLDMNVDDEPYELIHHKATDTIEHVDRHNLAVGAAMVAATAYAIADAPKRIAPRGPRKRP